jgi:hypothetical protein
MATPSQALASKAVTAVELMGTALEIPLAGERKEKFIKTLRSGSESKAGTLREAREVAATAKLRKSI